MKFDMFRKLWFILLIWGVFITAIHSGIFAEEVTMKIISPAFEHNTMVPRKYTCQGEDTSPPLVISDIPPQAVSLVLINDDPDATMGTWDHWIMWNITPTEKIEE